MRSRPFVYNDYDFGPDNVTPRSVPGDFGARGRAYGIGIGAVDVGLVSATDPTVSPSVDTSSQTAADVQAAQDAATAAQAQADSAAAQVVALQTQLDTIQQQGLTATGAVAASLQQQVSDLQAQIASQKTVASQAQAVATQKQSALQPYTKYLPYVAIGLVALVAVAFMVKGRK